MALLSPLLHTFPSFTYTLLSHSIIYLPFLFIAFSFINILFPSSVMPLLSSPCHIYVSFPPFQSFPLRFSLHSLTTIFFRPFCVHQYPVFLLCDYFIFSMSHFSHIFLSHSLAQVFISLSQLSHFPIVFSFINILFFSSVIASLSFLGSG